MMGHSRVLEQTEMLLFLFTFFVSRMSEYLCKEICSLVYYILFNHAVGTSDCVALNWMVSE